MTGATRFLAAAERQPVDRTPVWFMRQAGRCLAAYRELRETYDILTITRTPELCTHVTLMPVEEFGVDADAWREGAERVSGSWWDDWVAWAAERSGELVAAPRVPPGDPAPGSYAKGEDGRPFKARSSARRSLRELKLFRSTFPHAIITPGHDPSFYEQLEERYS